MRLQVSAPKVSMVTEFLQHTDFPYKVIIKQRVLGKEDCHLFR